jgi:flavin-binding protein dodecin
VSVYRVTELIGTSTESWEDAAATAVKTARETLRDLRVPKLPNKTSISTARVASLTAPSYASPSSTRRRAKRGQRPVLPQTRQASVHGRSRRALRR